MQRSDFGIGAWQSVIGNRVELRIEAEAVRDDDARAPEATDPAPAADDDTPAAAEAATRLSPQPESRP